MSINVIGEKAKKAARALANLTFTQKENALKAMGEALLENSEEILKANEKDIKSATEKGISGALLDRLTLNKSRISDMAEGILNVLALPDPVGEVISMQNRPNGLTIGQKRVPLGVVAIIYEARPNVTADAAALCFKTSNSVILRGGSEAINSNVAIVNALSIALESAGVTKDAIQLIADTSRETAVELMKLNKYVDVLIPRGGAGLIQNVVQNATVPIIETGAGNCHVYIDGDGDMDMGVDIIVNAKTQRPGVCNAAETLLVDSKIAAEFLPRACEALKDKNVEIRGCDKAYEILGDKIKKASEEDYETEYLDFVLAVKVVDGIDEAIAHIDKYSSGHSEAIVTESYTKAQKFLQEVDSAAVYVNASTRFTDGGEFGLGAEIGISTQKLHARGPMGLRELTTTKYIIYGNGQIR